MEKREAPQIVYKNGRPQGYRVGIGINGAYGICPFCGKAYTEEELEKSLAEKDDAKKSINFEHVYPRFAVKTIIDEKKKFGLLEHTFLVAVHKNCNTDGKILEDTLKDLVERDENGNFMQKEITPKQAKLFIRYCKKTSVFLRYMMDWENVPKGICYDGEDIDGSLLMLFVFDKNNIPETLAYNDAEDFMITFNSVGLWYRERKRYHRTVLDALCGDNENALFIECKDNKTRYVKIKNYREGPEKTFNKPILRNVSAIPAVDHEFEYALGLLPKYKHAITDYRVAPLLKTKLSLGGYLNRENVEVTFIQDGEFYLYKDGTKNALNAMECVMNCDLSHMDITILPNMTSVVVNNFDCSDNKLISLVGSPQVVKGDFVCDQNMLKSLEGAPKYVGGDFSCWMNPLVTLKGAPKEVGGNFTMDFNNLSDLEGAPRKVCGNFECEAVLTSLKGAPEYVGGIFRFHLDPTKFKSLEGLPPVAKCYGVYIDKSRLLGMKNQVIVEYKEFKTADEFRVWFNKCMSIGWRDWAVREWIEQQRRPKLLKSRSFGGAIEHILDMAEAHRGINEVKRKTEPGNQNEK